MTSIFSSEFSDDFSSKKNLKTRLNNSSVLDEKRSYLLLGCDEHTVYDGKNTFSLSESILHIPPNSNCLVLTENEVKKLVLAVGISNIKFHSIEGLFPFLKEVTYISSAEKNYKHLVHRISWIEKYPTGYSAYYAPRLFLLASRKIVWNSFLDEAFLRADNKPLQQALVFLDNRPNRSIIALDFNSMYASCLFDKYLDPSKLEFRVFNSSVNLTFECLDQGFYQVKLHGPFSDFFKKHHSFSTSFFEGNYFFAPDDTDVITAVLSRAEVILWSEHCSFLEIASGIISKKTISHPLKNKADSLYRERCSFKKQKNEEQASRCKFELSMLYSVMKRKIHKHISSNNLITLAKKIDKYGIIPKPNGLSYKAYLDKLVDGRKIALSVHGNMYHATFTSYDPHNQICSLYAQTLAYVRVKLLSLLSRIDNLKYADICYYNVDSVHVSLPKEKSKEFIESISDLIGESLGQLKIEAIAEHGVWFQTGKYFLIKDNKFVKTANANLTTPYDKTPLRTLRKVVKIQSDKNIRIPIITKVEFEKTLSYKQRLVVENNDFILYKRFPYSEVSTSEKGAITEWKEIEKTSSIKKQTLEELKKYLPKHR